MKNIFYSLFLLITGAFAFTSCSTLTSVGKSTPGVEMRAQFNFTMEDMEYLGLAKGTSTQSYVLGFPIGGRRQYYGLVGITGPGLNRGGVFSKRGYNNALYDALNSKPDADFILPISVDYHVTKMFLGKKVIVNIKGKAFKLKDKVVESNIEK